MASLRARFTGETDDARERAREHQKLIFENTKLVADNSNFESENLKSAVEISLLNSERSKLVSENTKLVSENTKLAIENQALKARVVLESQTNIGLKKVLSDLQTSNLDDSRILTLEMELQKAVTNATTSLVELQNVRREGHILSGMQTSNTPCLVSCF